MAPLSSGISNLDSDFVDWNRKAKEGRSNAGPGAYVWVGPGGCPARRMPTPCSRRHAPWLVGVTSPQDPPVPIPYPGDNGVCANGPSARSIAQADRRAALFFCILDLPDLRIGPPGVVRVVRVPLRYLLRCPEARPLGRGGVRGQFLATPLAKRVLIVDADEASAISVEVGTSVEHVVSPHRAQDAFAIAA
jgi:hypothetical protein